mmetsp:Transcript_36155/g.87439  ORF Transcript_36155/g.87439 Transcript_36155/m.87439 type:complete len:393 (+) Transcript_36155:1543-2721(+)
MMPSLQPSHTPQCRRVSFDPMISNSNDMNSIIRNDNNISLVSASSPLQVPTASSSNLKILKNSHIQNDSLPSLSRQLKRLRDSNTLKQAQTAIQALLPTVHNWIQTDSKHKASTAMEGPSSISANNKFPNALNYGNINSKSNNHHTQHSSIKSGLRPHPKTSSSAAANAGELFQKLHGVPILVLAFKEWEGCPLVVATTLRILAILVGGRHHEATIGHMLVEMGGLRIIVRAISKHHSKNEMVATACVALLSELAHHMPSTVGSDACLAIVVHSLWRFPKNGYLQGFGCLFFERVLLSRLLLWGVSEPKPLPSAANATSKGDNSGGDGGNDDETDTWSITTIHQQDTLKKVVVPLLIRMKKNHYGSNRALCETAEHLFQCINERLNNKVGFA